MSTPDRPGQSPRGARLRDPQFHKRLRRLIGAERPYSWADRVGISKGAFTRIWREGTVPTSELLHRIRRATGVSLDWLLTGEGSEATRGGAARAELAYVAEYAPAAKPAARKRTLGGASIGLMREWVQEWLDATPEDLAYVRVQGESMAPTLVNGDLVIVDRRATQPEQDGIYVLQQGATLRVRRVQRLSGDRYQAISDNARYRPFTFRLKAPIAVIGRVVWAGKRM